MMMMMIWLVDMYRQALFVVAAVWQRWTRTSYRTRRTVVAVPACSPRRWDVVVICALAVSHQRASPSAARLSLSSSTSSSLSVRPHFVHCHLWLELYLLYCMLHGKMI